MSSGRGQLKGEGSWSSEEHRSPSRPSIARGGRQQKEGAGGEEQWPGPTVYLLQK